MWAGISWYIGYQVMVQAYIDACVQVMTFNYPPR